MKINWFFKTYYGDKLQYKRPVWFSFKMLLEEIFWKITGQHYVPDGNGGFKKHKFCYKKHIL